VHEFCAIHNRPSKTFPLRRARSVKVVFNLNKSGDHIFSTALRPRLICLTACGPSWAMRNMFCACPTGDTKLS
jgi:hypothetical protein